MPVKKELCTFIHKPLDTKMSRTGTAKVVAKYIKKHKLNKEENKMYWTPDESLLTILTPLNEEDKERGVIVISIFNAILVIYLLENDHFIIYYTFEHLKRRIKNKILTRFYYLLCIWHVDWFLNDF